MKPQRSGETRQLEETSGRPMDQGTDMETKVQMADWPSHWAAVRTSKLIVHQRTYHQMSYHNDPGGIPPPWRSHNLVSWSSHLSRLLAPHSRNDSTKRRQWCVCEGQLILLGYYSYAPSVFDIDKSVGGGNDLENWKSIVVSLGGWPDTSSLSQT